MAMKKIAHDYKGEPAASDRNRNAEFIKVVHQVKGLDAAIIDPVEDRHLDADRRFADEAIPALAVLLSPDGIGPPSVLRSG